MSETAVTPVLDTSLLTPLGAYLRLRERGRASFLLESVERGRLGRHSVVGYLAYDFAAALEPTVPLPEPGRGFPESRFVVADVLVRFDHVRGVAEVLRGDAAEVARLLEADAPRGRRARRDAPLPVAGRVRGRRARVQGAHPRRRRVPDRALAARRAGHGGLRARPLPRPAPGQPVAVPLPARARRDRARRLLAGDAREVRGPAR